MPIYEYECKKCESRFEIHQSIKDDSLKIHDDCGGDLQKIYSASGIILKGSGFYKNDSRSSEKRPSAQRSSEKQSTASEKSSKSSEKSIDASKTKDKPSSQPDKKTSSQSTSSSK